MHLTTSELALAKKELLVIKDSIGDIPGRREHTPDRSGVWRTKTGRTAQETIEMISHPFLRNPQLSRFAHFFIHRAFAISGEYGLESIQWYIGRVGDSGQLVDYLHTDKEDLRVTASIVDADTSVNPSVRTCRSDFDFLLHFPDNDPGAIADKVYYEQIPPSILAIQEPEGSLVSLPRNRYHIEAPLPINALKMFMAGNISFH